MDGYWLIWCSTIIFILYTCGFKHTVLAYTIKQELILYIVVILLLMLYDNNVLFIILEGHAYIYSFTLIAGLTFIIALGRNNITQWGIIILSSGLLGLFYCLYTTIFLIYRGYEPAMLEWLVYVCLISIILRTVLKRHQLLIVIILAQICGEFLIYWHEKGEITIKIGTLMWWEFIAFLFVATICIYESLYFLAKHIKLFSNNNMKS